jgi:hypothetical protein
LKNAAILYNIDPHAYEEEDEDEEEGLVTSLV